MCSDVKIGQRPELAATAALPVLEKSLSSEKCGFVRKRLTTKGTRRKRQLECLDRLVRNRNLRVDDRIDDQSGLVSRAFQRACRPLEPPTVVGRDVEDDVRVDQDRTKHGSYFLVSARISSVVI